MDEFFEALKLEAVFQSVKDSFSTRGWDMKTLKTEFLSELLFSPDPAHA